MHKQRLGMKEDIDLAKKCYYLAAETNADAQIPVVPALLDLSVVYNIEFRKVVKLDK